MEKEITNRRFEGNTEIVDNVTKAVLKDVEYLGLGEKVKYEIQLAVTEAIENIVEHAYKGKGGKVEISLEVQDAKVVIRIHDYGEPFDPELVKEYKPEEQQENPSSRGRGIFIMRRCMDEVEYEFGTKGNTLTLIKNLGKNN